MALWPAVACSDDIEREEAKYRVEKGDTISSILDRLGFLRLYGPFGQVNKITSANKLSLKNNEPLIFPGQTLEISDLSSSKRHYYLIDENTHIRFLKRPVILSTQVEPKDSSYNPSPTPEPTPEPTSVPTKLLLPRVEERDPVKFIISPVFSSYKLTSKDLVNGGTAKLISNLNFGFKLDAQKMISEQLWLTLGFGYLHAKYNSPSSRPLRNPTVNFSHFQFGIYYHPSWLGVGIEFGHKQVETIRAVSSTDLEFETVNILHTTVRANAELKSTEHLDFGVKTNISVGIPVGSLAAVYESGLNSYGAGIYSVYRFSPKWRITPEVFGEQTLLRSSNLEQSRQEFGLVFRLEYTLP